MAAQRSAAAHAAHALIFPERVLAQAKQAHSTAQRSSSPRRMIFPERVLGRAGAQWMTSGVAMGPMALRTCKWDTCQT